MISYSERVSACKCKQEKGNVKGSDIRLDRPKWPILDRREKEKHPREKEIRGEEEEEEA